MTVLKGFLELLFPTKFLEITVTDIYV